MLSGRYMQHNNAAYPYSDFLPTGTYYDDNFPNSYSHNSEEYIYNDDVDELLNEIANSSPSPPERSRRSGEWGASPQLRFASQELQHHDEYGRPEPCDYDGNVPVFINPSQQRQYADAAVAMQRHPEWTRSPSPERFSVPYQQERSSGQPHVTGHSAYRDQPTPSGYPSRATTRLKPVSDLPDIYRSLFKFGVFNAVQSQCFDTVMHSDENMVISAPTGSGKTVLFELAIVKMLRELSGTGQKARCVYIAPTKSLCTEKASDWQTKFAPFGAKCAEMTGDTVTSGRGVWGDAKDASIIVTTGEKWDSLTRNWQDHGHILSQIKLFLMDEVHLLNETRGSTLEVVVSRMKLRGSSVRFVVVSATVPNVEDVAHWVGNAVGNGPASIHEFGDEFRPCKLSKFVYGIPRRKDTNDFVFAKALDYKLYGVLQQHCHDKPVLIFCPTRKGVMIAAEQILKEYEEAMSKKESVPWSKPSRIQHVFGNKQLDKLAACGIGVHHAGLGRDDRSATEQLYIKKALKVLFATSTLAVGVNLPAHTVIIKGVKLYLNNTSQEYSDLDVMQMIGRAGRPQFDKEGVAVIMCEQELEAKYRALAQGQTVLESSLHLSLAEHLNSEIALGTITDMQTAKEWLHHSFLFQRLRKNPAHYDIRKEGNKSWEERMDELVTDSVSNLKGAEMVKHDEDDGFLSSTEYGDIMSKFYIRQATMVSILKLSEKATVREILETLSGAEEFSDVRFRAGEKQVYNKLRTHNDIRYPIKKIDKPSDKVFILIQAILSAINLSDPEYKSAETQPYTESIPILRHIPRISRAVVEVANVRKAGGLLKNSLEVMRCLSAKAWEDRSVVFRQLDDIGLKSLKVLAEHNVTSFSALRKMDPGRIEMLLNRKTPFGHEVLAAVNQLPQYTLSISEIDVSSRKDGVEVELSIECGLAHEIKGQGKKKSKKPKRYDYTSVLTLTSDHNLIDFRRNPTSFMKDSKTFEVIAKLTKPSQSVVVYITSDTYAGVTVSASYKPNIQSSAFPVMDTRPQDALARDMEGLEDVAGFWDVGPNGEFEDNEDSDMPISGQPKSEQPVSNSVKNNVQVPDSPSGTAAAKQLPNGNFECNHTCKDKSQCRHLCCRDGLARPPPMTKRRMEQIIAANVRSGELQHSKPGSSLCEGSQKPKPKPKSKDLPKLKAKSERPLKELEALHDRMGVKDNLRLGETHRIKLDTEISTASKPARSRKPAPDFELDFLRPEESAKPTVEIDLSVSDSDDDLPDARDMLGRLEYSDPGQRAPVSDSTDYADPDVDALIAALPASDAPEDLPTRSPTARKAGDESAMMDWTSTARSAKRKEASDYTLPPAKRHNLARSESPIEVMSSPAAGNVRSNLFNQSLSDEGVSIDASQLFQSVDRSSPATSPASVRMDDQDGFVLDMSLFELVPSTPNLTEGSSAQPSQAGHEDAGSVHHPRRFGFGMQDSLGSRAPQDDNRPPSPSREDKPAAQEYNYNPGVEDNPLAEFEAWLQSGAVDFEE